MIIVDKLLDYTKPWSLPEVYLFTGNSTVKNNGAIVMGRGAARQVRDHFPMIDQSFGNIIKHRPNAHLAWITLPNEQHIGWFKVKDFWRDPAKLELIRKSTKLLASIANRHLNPELTFHMNFPGIGNGRLEYDSVLEIVSQLPDNVYLYKTEPVRERPHAPVHIPIDDTKP